LPAIQGDGRAGANGGGAAGGIVDTGSKPAKLLAQAEPGSGQRKRGDRFSQREEFVHARDPGTLSSGSGGGGDSGVGEGTLAENSQLEGQTGSGHAVGLLAGGAAGASATRHTGEEDAVAALVHGGPEGDPNHADSTVGSITEVLSPEQNAALLKVRHLDVVAHSPTAPLHWFLPQHVAASTIMMTAESQLHPPLPNCCGARYCL
jgi:hypothetical protein